MKVQKIVVGSFATNCYLLVKDDSLLLIDPGASFRKISQIIDGYENCSLKGILLTHGHFDHIGAVDDLVRKYGCPVFACQEDEVLLRNGDINSMAGISNTVTSKVNWLEGDSVNIGPFEAGILYTPGHTAGSVMFIIEGRLFSGDTLFARSVGRTDLYSGSYSQLKQSLQVVYSLPPEMVVYPGHDQETDIETEIRYNPYL